jgi:hypothetical protein
VVLARVGGRRWGVKAIRICALVPDGSVQGSGGRGGANGGGAAAGAAVVGKKSNETFWGYEKHPWVARLKQSLERSPLLPCHGGSENPCVHRGKAQGLCSSGAGGSASGHNGLRLLLARSAEMSFGKVD